MIGHAERGQGGFALLIVLWTLVLLALIAAQVNAAGRSESQLARNLLDGARAQEAADGAVFEAASRLLDPSDRHWTADGSAHALRRPGVAVTVRVTSETGKVNPNLAPAPLLVALIHAAGSDSATARELAAAILEWRAPDATGQGSAIAAAYRASGKIYAPPEEPFQTLDELGLVRGMTPDLLDRLRPHLTLFHDGDPDPRMADDIVLAALRDTGIQAAPAPPGGAPDFVVTIMAQAAASGGGRFTREATLRLGSQARGDQGSDAPYRILAWNP